MSNNKQCQFEASRQTSSATICKWCGREKWQHNTTMSNKQTDEQGKPLTYWGGLNNDHIVEANKKVSSIEWLIDQLEKWELYSKISFQCLKEIEQAKEMESLEKIDNFNDGWDHCEKYFKQKKFYNIVDTNEMINKQQVILGEHSIQMLEISDEEITNLANEHILYNNSKRQWVIEGMKLYREKLKTK